MQVSNILEEKSFQYTIEKPDMMQRSDEIDSLEEIVDYCKGIQEQVQYTENIWNIEVQEGVTFADYLYGQIGEVREDDRRRMQEMISKQFVCISCFDEETEKILVSLGEYEDAINNMREYIDARRNILKKIDDVEEYEQFMHSCFPNSCFAKDILSEMRYIQNFPLNVKEITDNLSVLDDEAIKLYEEYHDNLKEAMRILTAKLIECSPDSEHADMLAFPFVYQEQIDGENVSREKMVECSPHLKLIHKGSNLRIYFWWCDKDIGNGEKVLVGRIGRHPY